LSLVLDLAGLVSLDPGPAWAIGEASRLFRDRGGDFVVRSPQAQVRRVLDAGGLASLVATAPRSAS
jgi:anti-anti-sigma regulatory factor